MVVMGMVNDILTGIRKGDPGSSSVPVSKLSPPPTGPAPGASKREPKEFEMEACTGWGHSIDWWTCWSSDTGVGRVHGHMPHPKPRPGDIVTSRMASGKVGRFRLLERNYRSPADPGDQFFADVEFVGYQE